MVDNCHNVSFCYTDLYMDVPCPWVQYLENNTIWDPFLNMHACKCLYIKMSNMKYI